MQLVYRYTEQDVADAQETYARGLPTIQRVVYSVLLWILRLGLLGQGIFFVHFGPDTRSLGIVMLVASGILFAGRSARKLGIKRSAAKLLRKNPILQKEFKMEVSEQGLQTSADGLHTQLAWSNVIRWQESERLFLLYNTTRVYSIVPKRAFAPDEADRFRELLTKNVTRH